MPGENSLGSNPISMPANAALLQQLANAHIQQHQQSTPQPEMKAHNQVLAFLRQQKEYGQPTSGKGFENNLEKFVKEHVKSGRKDKNGPKLKLIGQSDIDHIQALLRNENTEELHQFMRNKRWSTVTLIIGDEIVTLNRPKSQTATLQYVNSHIDNKHARQGDEQLLDLNADAMQLLATRLLQGQAMAVANAPDGQQALSPEDSAQP